MRSRLNIEYILEGETRVHTFFRSASPDLRYSVPAEYRHLEAVREKYRTHNIFRSYHFSASWEPLSRRCGRDQIGGADGLKTEISLHSLPEFATVQTA